MLELVGLGLVTSIGLVLFVISFWSPWDTEKLWNKYGDMAIVRRKVRHRKLPILAVLGIVWAVGIVFQLVGKLTA